MDTSIAFFILCLISAIPALVAMYVIVYEGEYKWTEGWSHKTVALMIGQFFLVLLFALLFFPDKESSRSDEWFCSVVNGEKKCYREKDLP